jgi:hypothetical protein
MTTRKFVTVAVLSVCVVLLGGCVVGQTVSPTYEAGPQGAATGTPVALNVRDERPYVKNGEKPPYFIGQYRGGFGNPWNVSTEGDQPVATLLQRDLAKELQSLGHPVVGQYAGVRVLDVAIDDYQFDGYQNAKFWYLFNVRVIGPDGKVMAQSAVQDKQVIQGTFWEGAKGGVEKKLPELHADAIRKLVRDNPTILAALSAAPSAQ